MSSASKPAGSSKNQKGGFVLGLIVGLLVGLAVALGVALYITKVPIPFVNKVPQRTAEQDAAEAAKNKNWDPNAPLASKVPRPVASAPEVGASAATAATTGLTAAPASAPAAGGAATTPPSARNPAAILAGQATTAAGVASAPGNPKAARAGDPFTYFVQAGAFQRAEDAESQRAKLTMMGLEPRVLEREQSGRTVYRVRMGPFDKQAEAEALRDKLASTGMEAALVRVERPTP